MFCDLERLTERTARCRRCGRTGPIPGQSQGKIFWPNCPAGRKVAKRKTPSVPQCVHRGEQVSTIGCAHCGGTTVDVKVFACALHEECTIGPTKEQIRNCFNCADRLEPQSPSLSLPAPARKGPIRVGLVTPVFGTGGVERWWISLARHFPAGVVASGIALLDYSPTDQATIDELTRYAPAYGSLHLSRDGKDAQRGIERLANGDYAITKLVAHSDVLISWCTPHLKMKIKGLNRPIVLVSHGSGPWTKQILHDSIEHSTHFAAVCEAAAGIYPAAVRKQVTVIHNGVEIDRLVPTADRAELRARWGIPADAPTLLYVGRYSPEKDPLAAAKVAAGVPGMHALYCGTAFSAPQVQADVRQVLGDRAHFSFDGHVGNALAAADVQLLSSKEEGAPLVALEAWHACVPLAATDVGMLPDLRKKFGQLCAPCKIGDVESQRQAVLLAMHRGFRPVVEKARRIAWEHFTAPRMAARWAEFLEQVMGG